jgi:hypothetical protein
MRSFNGLVNQLSQFDGQLGMKMAPLRHLLKSESGKIQMNADELASFEELK